MNEKSVQELFTENVKSGLKTTPAFHYAIADITQQIVRQISGGAPLRAALEKAGLSGELASRINFQQPPAESLSIVMRLVISGGGGITGVPTAECLHRHLPTDREPTEEEVDQAWKACQKE